MSDPPAIAVFVSSRTEPGSTEWDEARWAGATIAEAGFAVVTGGYGGTMEAVSQGASEAGGHVIGVTSASLFPLRPGANPFVAEVIEAQSLAHRIDLMVRRAEATIALPGSIGTATELLIAWNTNYIAGVHDGKRVPTAAVGPAWRTVGRMFVKLLGATEDDIFWAETVGQGVSWVLDSARS